MKTIKILFTICTVLCIQNLYSQITLPDTANFYDYLDYYYSNEFSVNDTLEGGKRAQMNRLGSIWAPRLHPHGDFSVANDAIIDYSQNYTPLQNPLINPNWVCLGPSNSPGPNPNKAENGVGQVHRITFDPNYNGLEENGNNTIYVSSGHSGLWKATEHINSPDFTWVNIDVKETGLSSVADIVINPLNTDQLFIATGLPDEGIELDYGPNWANTNPIYTTGMYRSSDAGDTWESINDGFINHFISHGGAVRKLTIDESNPDVIFAATSKGIFRTLNSLASVAPPITTYPTWSKVFEGLVGDSDFRNVLIKPGNNNVIYAAGTDIYISNDGGTGWASMTGPGTGLDFSNLGSFYPERINIAVSQNNPEILWAYILGENNSTLQNAKKKTYIYLYENGLWVEKTSGVGNIVLNWMGMGVSPQDYMKLYFYGSIGSGAGFYSWIEHLGSVYWVNTSNYVRPGVYADGHAVGFQPNVSENPLLFVGHHGGVSFVDTELIVPGMEDPYEFRNKGLETQLFWSFDNSKFDKDIHLTANQDNGNYIFISNDWSVRNSGSDGYGARASYNNRNLMYYLNGGSPNLYSIDLESGQGDLEKNLRPIDPQYEVQSLLPKTFPLISLPYGTKDYIGFCELYERLIDYAYDPNITASDIWELESDISKQTGTDWLHKRQITELDYCQKSPKHSYIVIGSMFSEEAGGMHIYPRLFKTSNGGNNGNYGIDHYFDVPLNHWGLGPNDYPVISGIAVHPEDPDVFWLSHIGYDNITARVVKYNHGIWENADINNTLPKLPVNNIVYQYGSNDVIYIGTDAGVFYKEGSDPNWYEYGDFPKVRVTELSINYCSNKLLAATFGRALWEGDLINSTNPVCFEIDDGETIIYDRQKTLETGLRIKSGGKLIVHELLNMPANSKIIIEPGGKLTIDGPNAKITNSCDVPWFGIELHGNSLAQQDPSLQGHIVIRNGGSIENAVTGIMVGDISDPSMSGGIVEATDATFKNNVCAVKYNQYETQSASMFSNCVFWTDESYPHDYSTEVRFIQLSGTNGHRFDGCFFKHENPEIFETLYRGYGIYAFNSDFIVDEETSSFRPSLFENLYYGIKATASTSEKSVKIANSDFVNNYNGLYIGSIHNAIITSNSFTVPESDLELNSSYGLYLDESSGYHVENNSFTSIVSSQNTGLYVNNSGREFNRIYNNYFSSLYAASIYQDVNRNHRDGGLLVKCNDYNNNISDVTVVIEDIEETPDHGISFRQGSMENSDDAPAGNTFSDNVGHSWDIYNETNSINYIHHNDESAPNVNLIPVFNYGDVLVLENEDSQYSKEISCTSSLTTGGSLTLQSLNQSTDDINNVNYEIETLADGGDTDQLNFDVQTTMQGEELATRDMLLSESPNLSDTVMISTIEIENIMPNAMIRDVLVENPQAAKYSTVQTALDNKTDQMPQYMRDQIAQGVSTLSQLELLEDSLSNLKSYKSLVFKELMFQYKNDSTINLSDSLEALYIANNSIETMYRLMFLKLEANDTLAADSILNTISSNFDLSTEQELERQDYISLLNILKLIGSTLANADSSTVTALSNIMQNDYGRPAIYARSLLVQANAIEYQEPLLLPDTSLKQTMAMAVNEPEVSEEVFVNLNVHPNPTDDYFIVSLKVSEIKENIILNVSSINGSVIHSEIINSKENEIVIETKSWKPGLYIVNLLGNNSVLGSKKVTISR